VRKVNLPDLPVWQGLNERETIELELRLITPMFGGGYKAREVDEVQPIRPAAIRGHLRFWWRATAGARYTSVEELYKAERELWGGVSKEENPVVGKVAIRVAILEQGNSKRCAEFVWDNQKNRYKAVPRFLHGWPGYALHPFQGKADKGNIAEQPSEGLLDTKFRLIVGVNGSVDIQEIETALVAWILYGGLGARTRRGCGSIAANQPRALDLSWIALTDSARREWTTLVGAKYVLGEKVTSDPVEAWREAVELYQRFRQWRGFARAESPSRDHRRPGRSFWPEADSIRRITGQHHNRHAPEHPVECGFPRANLGLPIVFHFKDDYDPDDATLQRKDEGRTRMASPVITKAIQVGEQQYRPLIMVLNAPDVWKGSDLILKTKDGSRKITENQINLSESDRRLVKPLKECGNKPIRLALLEYAAQQWQSEIEVVRCKNTS
jgi:CRISPR-associated protein Cmr1